MQEQIDRIKEEIKENTNAKLDKILKYLKIGDSAVSKKAKKGY